MSSSHHLKMLSLLQPLPPEIQYLVGSYLDPRVRYIIGKCVPVVNMSHRLPVDAGSHLLNLIRPEPTEQVVPGVAVVLPINSGNKAYILRYVKEYISEEGDENTLFPNFSNGDTMSDEDEEDEIATYIRTSAANFDEAEGESITEDVFENEGEDIMEDGDNGALNFRYPVELAFNVSSSKDLEAYYGYEIWFPVIDQESGKITYVDITVGGADFTGWF